MFDKPLRTVSVGARVRLLPDAKVRIKSNEYRCNPNASLGLPMDEDLVVSEVMVSDNIVLIGVNDCFKRVDMRRFTGVGDYRAQ